MLKMRSFIKQLRGDMINRACSKKFSGGPAVASSEPLRGTGFIWSNHIVVASINSPVRN
jgi:hypothetical protein